MPAPECGHPFRVATVLDDGTAMVCTDRLRVLLGPFALRRRVQLLREQLSVEVSVPVATVWWCDECTAWKPMPGESLPEWAVEQCRNLR